MIAAHKNRYLRESQELFTTGTLGETSMKEMRERVAEETIQRTPGGVEKLGLLTSVDSARKRKLPTNVHVTRSVAREQGIKIEGLNKEGSE